MRANWQKWSEDQIGVELAGTPEELRKLAGALVTLSREPDQHLHITESGKGGTRVADIELSVLPDPGDTSMAISGMAIAPGTAMRDPGTVTSRASARGGGVLRWLGFLLVVAGVVLTHWNRVSIAPALALAAGAVLLDMAGRRKR